ncbi:hypothetical protein [Klebsiella pneumoniae]|uniref:hypothetical protein n=1 Tax=Klebsiella pneumoniae TaxID=573 RepID=UPI00162861CF|nr:hypothetical protein [Klebsiella pneumoniae]
MLTICSTIPIDGLAGMPSGYHSFLTFIDFTSTSLKRHHSLPQLMTDIKLGFNHQADKCFDSVPAKANMPVAYTVHRMIRPTICCDEGGESRDLRNVMSDPPAALPVSHYKYSKASSKPHFQTQQSDFSPRTKK